MGKVLNRLRLKPVGCVTRLAAWGHVTCPHQGWFAEVRVYCLGLFAVLSCLKTENYTVPTKGLSLRLNADPRICLSYLPGCFAAPVVAQTMVGVPEVQVDSPLQHPEDGRSRSWS